jgi:hypothetical protein
MCSLFRFIDGNGHGTSPDVTGLCLGNRRQKAAMPQNDAFNHITLATSAKAGEVRQAHLSGIASRQRKQGQVSMRQGHVEPRRCLEGSKGVSHLQSRSAFVCRPAHNRNFLLYNRVTNSDKK